MTKKQEFIEILDRLTLSSDNDESDRDLLREAIENSVILTKEQAICIRDCDESANFENVMSDIEEQLEQMSK